MEYTEIRWIDGVAYRKVVDLDEYGIDWGGWVKDEELSNRSTVCTGD